MLGDAKLNPPIPVGDLHRNLIRLLSPDGICACCGERVGIAKLEVDHVDGRTWSARAFSRPQRVHRYWEEAQRGVRLRALCRSCNAVDGNHRRWSKEKAS